MKSGHFFWGSFFVVIGLLLLLSNLSFLHVDWGYAWRLWPLILVFWGLSKFTQQRAIRISLAGLNGLIFACIVFSFFSFQWLNIPFDDEDPPRYTQHFSEPYDSSISKASFTFNGGAGKFVIEETSNELVEAQTETGLGEYTMEKDDEDGAANVYLKMKDRRSFRFFHRLKNRAEIRLNSHPSWDIRFEAGASGLDLDLTPYKTERVTIDAGVSTIHLKIGERSEETYVKVKAGVSTVRIQVPSSSGCEIDDNAHIGSTDFDGFSKTDDRMWQTDNYDNAAKKVHIDIDTGVSSVRVVRY